MFQRKGLKFLPIFVAAFMILGLLSTGVSSKEVPGPSDDFNDNIIDLAKWHVPDFDAPFGLVAEVNQQLEMSLTSDNTKDNFGIAMSATWQLAGDFDIQVDYHLLIWPEENKIRVGLIAGRKGYGGNNVERTGGADPFDPGPLPDLYLTNFGDWIQGEVETDVEKGSLRMVREGHQISGYYSDITTGGDWVLIHTGPPLITEFVIVRLSIWGHGYTPDVLA